MKKLLLILVAAILVLILPAGVVAAKAVANRLEFNLDGTYDIGGEDLDASAVLTGNLREKDGNLYLSPLKGTITIDGKKHDISVKAKKQSDPLRYFGPPSPLEVNMQDIIVNVKGSKAASYDGLLVLGKDSHDDFYSELYFSGTVNGEFFECSVRGEYPIID